MTRRSASRYLWILLIVGFCAGALVWGTPHRQLFAYGIRCGMQDAVGGVDLGLAMRMDPPTALMYLGARPALVENRIPVPGTPAEERARGEEVRNATHLAQLVADAPPIWQSSYLKVFVIGYRLGHR